MGPYRRTTSQCVDEAACWLDWMLLCGHKVSHQDNDRCRSCPPPRLFNRLAVSHDGICSSSSFSVIFILYYGTMDNSYCYMHLALQ